MNDEANSSRFQFGTLNERGHNVKYLPYVFTEEGVSQLSGVLHNETVFTLLDKRAQGVQATIYTSIGKTTQLDIKKHNAQYRPIEVKQSKNIHDRFLIIDEVVYHIGASIKDLGKKLFAFSKMEINKDILIEHL